MNFFIAVIHYTLSFQKAHSGSRHCGHMVKFPTMDSSQISVAATLALIVAAPYIAATTPNNATGSRKQV